MTPMSSFELALLGLAVMLVLLALRLPVAIAMLLAGMGGYIALSGVDPVLAYLKTAAYWRFASYDFSVIPMFLLMGEFASRSGLSRSLFSAANVFLGHRRGGVAMAAVGGCGAFGAICGSCSTLTMQSMPSKMSAPTTAVRWRRGSWKAT